MMIAIPNMEKPKYCRVCHERLKCKQYDGEILHTPDDCPLTEIVTCSECKHLEVINGAKIYAHCPMWEIDFKPFEDDTRTNYCSWGERRTDPNNCKECELTNECDHHICLKVVREGSER